MRLICKGEVHQGAVKGGFTGSLMGNQSPELANSDVVGPMEHQSIGRSKYFVPLLDSFSRYSLGRFINCKSGAINKVIKII